MRIFSTIPRDVLAETKNANHPHTSTTRTPAHSTPRNFAPHFPSLPCSQRRVDHIHDNFLNDPPRRPGPNEERQSFPTRRASDLGSLSAVTIFSTIPRDVLAETK